MRTRFLILLALVLIALMLPVPALAQERSFTIANGQSLSGAVDMQGCTPMRIIVNPTASGTGWTTADLTFQHSDDGVVYGNMRDEYKVEVTVGVSTDAASAASPIQLSSPAFLWSLRWLKIRSGTAGSAVNQAAARTIRVICR
jgi:hypothetical protein